MRRLESGATVALLIDRPPVQTAVEAQLFGRAFQVSNAAAELARASGCAILPVCVWREAGTYSIQVMPPVPYERARLRDRTARQQLTQSILDCFAPFIAKYPDQWYHFVPAWPAEKN
jgi:lauroyl/myristoyl acyltransferase